MTKADAARLVAVLVTAYPNYDKFNDDKAVASTVGLWATMFAADDAAIVGLALQKHVATSKWPPSVAEIREIMLEIQHPELVPPERAWLAVSDLLYTAGQFNHGDLHQQLPPLVARAVESIGWGNLWEMHRGYCVGDKPGMDRLAFIQQYAPMYDRERLRAMTPERITAQIDAAAAALPDRGQRLLAQREADRRAQDAAMAHRLRLDMGPLLEQQERRQLAAGDEEMEDT